MHARDKAKNYVCSSLLHAKMQHDNRGFKQVAPGAMKNEMTRVQDDAEFFKRTSFEGL